MCPSNIVNVLGLLSPRHAACAFVGVIFIVAAPAAASQPAAEPTTTAGDTVDGDGDDANEPEARRDALFAEAIALSQRDRWSEAAEKIRAVIALRSSPKALIALGYAEIRVDQLVEARRTLSRARSEATALNRADAVARAEAALTRLEKLLPRVSVRVRDGVELTAVEVDGERAAVVDDEFSVDPGARRILIRTTAGPLERSLDVKRGDRLVVDAMSLLPPESPSVPREATPLPRSEPAIPMALVATDPPESPTAASAFPVGPALLGIAGLVTAGVGGYFYLDGRADHLAASDQCGTTCGSDEWDPQFDAASKRMVTGDVLLGVGGALVIGGVIWWVFAGDAQPEGADSPAPRVGLMPLDGGAYGSVRVGF